MVLHQPSKVDPLPARGDAGGDGVGVASMIYDKGITPDGPFL